MPSPGCIIYFLANVHPAKKYGESDIGPRQKKTYHERSKSANSQLWPVPRGLEALDRPVQFSPDLDSVFPWLELKSY